MRYLFPQSSAPRSSRLCETVMLRLKILAGWNEPRDFQSLPVVAGGNARRQSYKLKKRGALRNSPNNLNFWSGGNTHEGLQGPGSYR